VSIPSERQAPLITREEGRAFARRWRLANAEERRLLRETSMEQKLRQLAALMASVDQMGWDADLGEDRAARERWALLRRSYGV